MNGQLFFGLHLEERQVRHDQRRGLLQSPAERQKDHRRQQSQQHRLAPVVQEPEALGPTDLMLAQEAGNQDQTGALEAQRGHDHPPDGRLPVPAPRTLAAPTCPGTSRCRRKPAAPATAGEKSPSRQGLPIREQRRRPGSSTRSPPAGDKTAYGLGLAPPARGSAPALTQHASRHRRRPITLNHSSV